MVLARDDAERAVALHVGGACVLDMLDALPPQLGVELVLADELLA